LLLAKVHPLLGAAVGLDEGESITGFLMPQQSHHPAEMWSVRALPMKLGMQAKGLLKGLLKLLQVTCAPPPLLPLSLNAQRKT
jgi:hypothetical protein